LADEARAAERRKEIAGAQAALPSPSLFRCGVGRAELSLDPYGTAHACMLLKGAAVDLAHVSLQEAWDVIPGLLAQLDVGESRCRRCPYPGICLSCPAQSLLEGLPAGEPVEFLCRLGQLRRDAYGVDWGPMPD
jgi:radical SAM protein with 4Fe4S-binding SPASM domain